MTPSTTLSPQPEIVVVNGDTLYETVNGQRVETAPMGVFETWIASRLVGLMEPFTRSRKLGRVVSETLFLLNAAARLERRPDLAFVSYQRWAENRLIPRVNAWNVAPNLAIEVV